MKPRKNTILIMLLGLLLVAFAAAMAQTPAQGDQKKRPKPVARWSRVVATAVRVR